MTYAEFRTRTEAAAYLRSRQAAGYRGIVLAMRADWYEVRTWR